MRRRFATVGGVDNGARSLQEADEAEPQANVLQGRTL